MMGDAILAQGGRDGKSREQVLPLSVEMPHAFGHRLIDRNPTRTDRAMLRLINPTLICLMRSHYLTGEDTETKG